MMRNHKSVRITDDDMRDAARLADALRRETAKRGLPEFPALFEPRRTRGQRRRRRAGRTVVATLRGGRTVAQRSYARRRPLAPLIVTGLLYGAGAGFYLSPHGPATVPLFALPVGALVWWRARRKEWRRNERIYAAAITAAGYGWVQAASLAGVGSATARFLVLPALAAAVPWWWHHRIRDHGPLIDDERLEVWAWRVAGQGGALPGSQLRDLTPMLSGWSATVRLVGGKQTTAEAVHATARIASAYGVPPTSVVIEASPTADADKARLMVFTENPLQKVQPWTGPGLDMATGRFPIGVYPDGSSATWRLFTRDWGANHGLIAGGTGSGKSMLVNVLCAEIRHSGVCVLWLGDPEEGVSVPDWQDAADWFAGGVSEIRRMLRAAERVMQGRGRRRARVVWTDEQGQQRKGRAEFNPTREEPQLTLIIDESPDVWEDPECARIAAAIGKKGRKLGVSIVVIAQVPSVSELGGNGTLRSQVTSTNITIFRVTDRQSGPMAIAKDLPVNPKDLPGEWPDGSTTAGLGYVASTGGRVSPMRGLFMADPFRWATCDARVARLDAESAADAGEDYATWRDRRDLDDDEDRLPAPVVALHAAPASVAPEKMTIIDTCLAELRECGQRVTTGALAVRVAQRLSTPEKEGRAPLPTVSTSLKRLEREGHVVKVDHGLWAAAAPERRTA
ncbi:MAG TPA: hypothetical protein VFW64_12370 [Pseudonocardiaceae bacterium]|nr:hypothetical protein [Pseudonocardiaceae bacterium]